MSMKIVIIKYVYIIVQISSCFLYLKLTVAVLVGETGASYYNLQLIFVKSMLDALFISTYTLNLLFVLIKCTMILHIIGR